MFDWVAVYGDIGGGLRPLTNITDIWSSYNLQKTGAKMPVDDDKQIIESESLQEIHCVSKHAPHSCDNDFVKS